MPELRAILPSLTVKAKRLLAKNGQVGEENTKAVLVEPMLQALGWDIHDLEEVQREFRYKPQGNPVDYALLVSGKPRLFVEAKSLGRDLGQHKWKTQAVNYANTAGVEWCVLTDGNFWQVYKSNAPGDLDQKLFLQTWLHNPEGRPPPYETQYVLSLLARDKLAENDIETLWQVLNIDRRGREALLGMVETKNPSLVRLIRKWSGLTRKQVEAFLSRAEVTIQTPPVTLGAAAATPPRTMTRRAAGERAETARTYCGNLLINNPQQLTDQEILEKVREPFPGWGDDDRVSRVRSWLNHDDIPAFVGVGERPIRRYVTQRPRGKKTRKAERRGRRAHEPRVPGLPTQRQLEVPLLRAILKRGGVVQVRAQGREVDEALADQFSLTTEQRTTTFPDRPESVWSNRIRWTRMSLVQKGELDGSQRGMWRLTEQGRRRAESG